MQAHSQSCRTDISCSFSDKIRGIRGVIDGLCADDPPCKSGCFVGESLGHPVELTHLWCHIVIWYNGGLIGHDRQEHISTYFAQQLKNSHPLMSTLSIWQGDTIGGPTPAWLAPGIKFLHQIMSMNQRQELDVHKKPEPCSLTQNSLPNLMLFPSIWVPFLNCLMSYSALSRPVLTLRGFGVGNMKHQSSYQCS